MVQSVSKDINYLASLGDFVVGAPSTSAVLGTSTGSSQQLQQISSGLPRSIPSGAGLEQASSRQVLHLLEILILEI